ncbi:Protein of unknown function [Halopseudomonas formosensis]|uniref:DUF1302 domain-containing protein n=1 Tax=Halopseudomonas formosensis TaxID=1002526 RepID=A0A1I6A302_9GAMM|nr:DUF1302 family protein [Halopseudomonas formosensis]SFQ62983.1 Protein of unknown function [Halopseudomonas formosensis]
MQNNNKKAIQRSSTGFAFASLAIAVAAFAANDVQAGETFRFDNGATLDWSVTTSYGLGIRMEDADSKLLDGQANADDGNRNFDRHSLMTHRVTALGEIILRKDNYGAVLRGSTFYDDVYHRSNDNDSPGTVNKDGDHNEFTSDAKKYSGGRSRFLDAYVFADFELPARQRLGVKAGRHVVAWGEGLFYPGVNGVQGPVNVVNSGQPGIEVKDIMLPVGQVSANWEVNPDFGLSAYAQYEWKGNELNPVGSFLSTSDVTGPGRQFMILGPGFNAAYAGTNDPRDSGQYGIRAMYRPTLSTELGFFHVRYHDRNPGGVTIAPDFQSYEIEYVEDIKLTGMSFSTSVGDTQVGGEWSYRTGAPVMLAGNQLTTGSGQQMQLSFIRAFGDMPWASSTTIMGEVVHVRADDVDDIDGNDDFTYKTATGWQSKSSTAYTLQTVLSYPGIFSGWDLNIPVNWSHVVEGNTPLKGTIAAGAGDKRMSVGATFKYLGNLELNTTYTAYLYSGDPSRNRMLSDRDYLTISAKYTF